MTESKPHEQYTVLTTDEYKIVMRLRATRAGIMTIEKDGDDLKWSVAGYWERPARSRITASGNLAVEIQT